MDDQGTSADAEASAQDPEQSSQEHTEKLAVQTEAPAEPKVAFGPRARQQAKNARPAYQKALSLIQSGELDAAIRRFNELHRQYPQLAGPLINVAIIHLRREQYEAAKRNLERAIGINEANPYAHNLLGVVNRHLGRFEAARAAYARALSLDADFARAHFNLAVLLDLYLQKPEQALEHFKRYQSLSDEPDQKVKGWIAEISRRVDDNSGQGDS